MRRLLRIAVLGLIWGGQAEYAGASTFSVSPTRVTLAPGSTSVVLTLANDNPRAIRFELSAFAWDETEDGHMQLVETKDIVFYPPLLTIEPGQSRRIRVGSVSPFGAVEKTYRLFVEELPNNDEAGGPDAGVRVRTKMGIPVFLRGPRPTTETGVEGLELHDGLVSFHVTNRGTAHVVLQRVQIRGLSATGDEVFAQSIDGWYLLAGHRRQFHALVPPDGCSLVTTISVVAESDRGVAGGRLETPSSTCHVE